MNPVKQFKFQNKLALLLISAFLVLGIGGIAYAQYDNLLVKPNDKSTFGTSPTSGNTLEVGTADQQLAQPVADTATLGSPNDTTSNSSQAPSTNKAYSAGICTETPIRYTTKYEDNPYLPIGQQKVRQEGKDGYRSTCTPNSDGKQILQGYTYPGYDKIIENGTYVAPTSTYQPPKNYSQCNQFSGTGAYQACIDAVNRQ